MKRHPFELSTLCGSLGGWDYGDFSLVLDADKAIWLFDIKTTITSDPDPVCHEGSVNLAVNRGTWTWNQQSSQGWACGTGHIQLNKLTYNTNQQTTGRYCWTDGCYDDGKPSGMSTCYGTFFGSIPKAGSQSPAQLRWQVYTYAAFQCLLSSAMCRPLLEQIGSQTEVQ